MDRCCNSGESQRRGESEEKGSTSAQRYVFFQCFVALEGRKVGPLKRRRAIWGDERGQSAHRWREAHPEFKMRKAPHVRSAFGSCDAQKVDAAVARSTFGGKNGENTSWSRPLCSWDVEKCTSLWREEHCEVKMLKTPRAWFGALKAVEMFKECTPLWCEAHFEAKLFKPLSLNCFWKLRGWKIARLFGPKRFWTFNCHFSRQLQLRTTAITTTAATTTLHYARVGFNYTTPLHYTTLNYTTLHYTTLNYTTLHYPTLD